MGRRLHVDWNQVETLTDEYLMEVFGHFVKRLTDLVIHEHSDGRSLVLLDENSVLRHFVYCIDDQNWACWCRDAIDGECSATTYARVRRMTGAVEGRR